MTPFAKRGALAILAASLLFGSTFAPVLAQDGGAAPETPAAEAPAGPLPDAVVATVGDMTITEADLAFAAEDLQQEIQQVPPEERRAFLVTVLIDMKVMAKAAKDAGMANTELFKRRLAYLEDRALRRAYFAETVAAAVTEDSIRAAYDEFVSTFQPIEEVRARHILVETEDEANAVKAELDGGKPFEVLAMEKTLDPSGKQNGGDLGFFQQGMMVPQFETVAFALEPGAVSDPVESQFGWHVIKLEEKRMSAPPAFEQVAQQLSQQVMYQAFDDSVGALKAASPVDIPDPALAAAVQRQSAAAEAEPATP
jgi:peptidyl-prolyl cis-trans isomerase C